MIPLMRMRFNDCRIEPRMLGLDSCIGMGSMSTGTKNKSDCHLCLTVIFHPRPFCIASLRIRSEKIPSLFGYLQNNNLMTHSNSEKVVVLICRVVAFSSRLSRPPLRLKMIIILNPGCFFIFRFSLMKLHPKQAKRFTLSQRHSSFSVSAYQPFDFQQEP